MKKIINNRLYNTETAQKIGSDGSNGSHSDFHWWSETLYQKRTGEFFVHGEGGPMSRYSRSVGQNEWTGGEQIIPMNYENARKWAEEHLDAEDYEVTFGTPDEDGETAQLHVDIPTQLMMALKNKAASNEESLTAFVRRILDDATKLER